MILLFPNQQLLPLHLLAIATREKHYFKLCFGFMARAVQQFLTGCNYRAVSGIGNPRFRIAWRVLNCLLQIHLFLKEMKICIVRFLSIPLSLSIV